MKFTYTDGVRLLLMHFKRKKNKLKKKNELNDVSKNCNNPV